MNKSVLCYGEVLWDILPTGMVPGGAPMNVAFHLNQLGLVANILSRVGADKLGQELIQFLQTKGIATNLIQQDESFPTGTVEFALDKKGSPSYTIHRKVAWDHIEIDSHAFDVARNAELVVFGSLVCRHPQSRHALLALLDHSKLRVLDVNFRPPHFDKKLVAELLLRADIIKVADWELKQIVSWYTTLTDEREQMRWLAEKFALDIVLLTKGKNGCICLDNERFYAQAGFAIDVKDTIGSGDAFLAAYLIKMLDLASPAKCLEYACAMGALVATFEGGTPSISTSMIEKFITQHSP